MSPKTIFVLSLLVIHVQPIHSMDNFYIQLWHSSNKNSSELHRGKIVDLPSKVLEPSRLITTMQHEFKDTGEQLNPLNLIIPRGISAYEFKEFFLSSIPVATLEEKIKSLSLACYLNMPSKQRCLEQAIKNGFRCLEIDEALEQASAIQKLDLPLPASLFHLLAAQKLTEYFISGNPVSVSETKPLHLSIIDEKKAALKKKVIDFHGYHPDNLYTNKLHFDDDHIILVSSAGKAVALYRDMTALEKLLYFDETRTKPLVFDHGSSSVVTSYAINPQADKIISYDHTITLVAWDKVNIGLKGQEHYIWIKTVVDHMTYEYYRIIFSQDGKLFITLDSQYPPLGVTIKVWDSTTNKMIASYSLAAEDRIDNLDFIAHNKQIFIRIDQTSIKIFDIKTQSVIEEWLDTTEMTANYLKNQQFKKSLYEQYYLRQDSLTLYSRYHQPILKINQESLNLPSDIISRLLKAEFDQQGSIIIKAAQHNNKNFFTFNLTSLDTILAHADTINLSQAVALLLCPKDFYEQTEQDSPLRTIIASLPKCIRELLLGIESTGL